MMPLKVQVFGYSSVGVEDHSNLWLVNELSALSWMKGCSVCSTVSLNALKLHCKDEHILCQICSENNIEKNDGYIECPLHGDEVGDDEATITKIRNPRCRLLAEVVLCPKFEKGCKFKGSLKDLLETHHLECVYRDVECSSSLLKMTVGDIDAHTKVCTASSTPEVKDIDSKSNGTVDTSAESSDGEGETYQEEGGMRSPPVPPNSPIYGSRGESYEWKDLNDDQDSSNQSNLSHLRENLAMSLNAISRSLELRKGAVKWKMTKIEQMELEKVVSLCGRPELTGLLSKNITRLSQSLRDVQELLSFRQEVQNGGDSVSNRNDDLVNALRKLHKTVVFLEERQGRMEVELIKMREETKEDIDHLRAEIKDMRVGGVAEMSDDDDEDRMRTIYCPGSPDEYPQIFSRDVNPVLVDIDYQDQFLDDEVKGKAKEDELSDVMSRLILKIDKLTATKRRFPLGKRSSAKVSQQLGALSTQLKTI